MKSTITLLSALLLLTAASAWGQGLRGDMSVTAYAGWSLGFGDDFDDYQLGGFDYSSSAGLTFGGIFHYRLNEMMAVGGELMMQSYKEEREASAEHADVPYYLSREYSDTDSRLNFLFNGAYTLRYDEETGFYLLFGGGLYDTGETEIGINGGISYTKQLTPTLNLVGAPRLHLILADETVMLLQLTVGVQFILGPR